MKWMERTAMMLNTVAMCAPEGTWNGTLYLSAMIIIPERRDPRDPLTVVQNFTSSIASLLLSQSKKFEEVPKELTWHMLNTSIATKLSSTEANEM